MSTIQSANLGLRFLLEMGALGALGYWGFQAGGDGAGRYLLGVGLPLLAAATWGMFGSPNAPMPAPGVVRVGLEVAILGGGAAALAGAGHPGWGAAFGAAALVNGVLMHVWGQ